MERYHERMSQESSPEPRVVLVTAPAADEASRLARGMLDARLAACVNVIPGARSFYRWKGEVQEAEESMLLIKTTDARLEELVEFIEREHSFDLPEFIVLDPEAVEHGYRDWLLHECAPAGDAAEGAADEA